MKRLIFLLPLLCAIPSLASAADTAFTFATIERGQKILTANDNYFNRMGPAEIAIRTRSTTADKTAEDLKTQYRANVLEWTSAEKEHITKLIADNHTRLEMIRHLLPSEIAFIKVNDKVEGGLPHTRANAIILPIGAGDLTEKLFYHELFHVLSRHQKKHHENLYGLIGFHACAYNGNTEVNTKSLTNPDVPAEGYYLPVTLDENPAAIMTFLHASREAFDPEIERGFGGHFGFGLLKVTAQEGTCRVEVNAEGKAQILSPAAVPDFFAAIGKNTDYIIHPEEVLAENFVFVMLETKDLPNPEIPARLKDWLIKK